MAQVVRCQFLVREVWGSDPKPIKSPATRYRCNLDAWDPPG